MSGVIERVASRAGRMLVDFQVSVFRPYPSRMKFDLHVVEFDVSGSRDKRIRIRLVSYDSAPLHRAHHGENSLVAADVQDWRRYFAWRKRYTVDIKCVDFIDGYVVRLFGVDVELRVSDLNKSFAHSLMNLKQPHAYVCPFIFDGLQYGKNSELFVISENSASATP